MTFARNTAVALVVLLLLVAGAWSSWDTARHVLSSEGHEHGTLTVTGCNDDTCSGRYVPDDAASSRRAVRIAHSVAAEKGDTLPVVVKPGTDEAVRAGWGGGLHAWLPLGGALLLAAPLIGGGMRLVRVAWWVAGAGTALLLAAFFTL